METLRVPKRGVAVKVFLEGGHTLEGEVFVPASGPYGGPGRLIDRLNDQDEDFMPLSGEAGTSLVNKARVIAVEVPPDYEEADDVDAAPSLELQVEIKAIESLTLAGRVLHDMPPGQRRTLDYLNAAPAFITLLGESGATLIRRTAIVGVREQTAAPTTG